LTDHNTLSGAAEAEQHAAKLGLVLVPGVEVTTFRGHAVVLGVTSVPEWRDLETRGMDALADEVHAQGGVLSVAHPAALGSPVCSGCAWDWPVAPASIDLWEVMNGSRLSPEVPLELWRQLLAGGGWSAPVGGGDVHSTAAAGAVRPATYVIARDRSTRGVLDALRSRRVYASMAQRLDLWLRHRDGRIAVLGETVEEPDEWVPRTDPDADVVYVECDNGRCCVFAVLRDDQGIAAVTAPIWIRT